MTEKRDIVPEALINHYLGLGKEEVVITLAADPVKVKGYSERAAGGAINALIKGIEEKREYGNVRPIGRAFNERGEVIPGYVTIVGVKVER